METSPDVDLPDLIARVRDGDNDAWVALTDRYTNLLWSIARQQGLSTADAADAIQTTWLRLVEHIDRIRQPERLVGWLATTLRRECGDIRERAARVRPVPPDDPTGLDRPDPSADPLDAALLRDERDAELWRAFGALRPACQELLRVLIADPAPSYREVSLVLRMAVGSIGPTRERCLKCLRDILRGVDEAAASQAGV
ncbi:MAG TPA: sigma-70 family RNA polymerase sigma factor [Asanoa sp.]|nr:sigma-70 family RNA polymerase sigma factor [Asanoa sp.]